MQRRLYKTVTKMLDIDMIINLYLTNTLIIYKLNLLKLSIFNKGGIFRGATILENYFRFEKNGKISFLIKTKKNTEIGM